MTHEKHIAKAVELSKTSFAAGEFPAGAVLVTKSGSVYVSRPSLPHYHGEMMVIDDAINNDEDLKDAILYGSMQSCLMCTAKMYWAGIETSYFVIPKDRVKTEYGYEDETNTKELASRFVNPIKMIHWPSFQDEAESIYSDWIKKIES